MSLVRSLCLLYAGMILGVSFIATPAKFLAPDLTTGQLLLVGRTTFGVFAWIEGVMIAVLVPAALAAKWMRRSVMCVAAGLLAQHIALRPLLDARVTAILAGGDTSMSLWHHFYGLIELGKFALLLQPAWRRFPLPAVQQIEPRQDLEAIRDAKGELT